MSLIDVSVLYTRIIAICEVVKAKGSLGQSTYLTQDGESVGSSRRIDNPFRSSEYNGGWAGS
ncbi:hypothetical protein Bca52824_060317 [Brassica carinata]|uniref:Uncharacterized protein n=1 Tax=Brassica carinata TaxID=52824 RepID=A0A8X7QXA3_BRACI|nr:hypothetical protein Bca52824_060317 [Brassica carinata]